MVEMVQALHESEARRRVDYDSDERMGSPDRRHRPPRETHDGILKILLLFIAMIIMSGCVLLGFLLHGAEISSGRPHNIFPPSAYYKSYQERAIRNFGMQNRESRGTPGTKQYDNVNMEMHSQQSLGLAKAHGAQPLQASNYSGSRALKPAQYESTPETWPAGLTGRVPVPNASINMTQKKSTSQPVLLPHGHAKSTTYRIYNPSAHASASDTWSKTRIQPLVLVRRTPKQTRINQPVKQTSNLSASGRKNWKKLKNRQDTNSVSVQKSTYTRTYKNSSVLQNPKKLSATLKAASEASAANTYGGYAIIQLLYGTTTDFVVNWICSVKRFVNCFCFEAKFLFFLALR